MNLRSRRVRSALATVLLGLLIRTTAFAAPGDPAPAGATDRSGASLAEKIACVYLLVGGSIMLYYGPKERENGQLTRDGASEAVGGAAAIGISVALLRDIIKKGSHHQPRN